MLSGPGSLTPPERARHPRLAPGSGWGMMGVGLDRIDGARAILPAGMRPASTDDRALLRVALLVGGKDADSGEGLEGDPGWVRRLAERLARDSRVSLVLLRVAACPESRAPSTLGWSIVRAYERLDRLVRA